MSNGSNAAMQSGETRPRRRRHSPGEPDRAADSGRSATPPPAGPATRPPSEFEPNWAMLAEFPEDRVRIGGPHDIPDESRRLGGEASATTRAATGATASGSSAVERRGRSSGTRPPVFLALLLLGTTAVAGSYMLLKPESGGVLPAAETSGPPDDAAPASAGPAGVDVVAPRTPVAPAHQLPPAPVEPSVAAAPPAPQRAPQAAPEPATVDAPPAGPSRDMVATAQRRLSEAGFPPGPVDGAMGAQTRQAVRRFQHHIGVSADGIVDAAMLRRLDDFQRSRATPAAPPAAAAAPEVDDWPGLPPDGDTRTGRTIVVWGGKTVLGTYERPAGDPGSGGPGSGGPGATGYGVGGGGRR